MKISTSQRKNKILKILRKILAAVLWIAVWQIAYMSINKEILMASPLQVLSRLAVLMGNGDFWLSAGTSLLRIIIGYLVAVVIGAVLAMLTCALPLAYDFFYPVISIIKSTPVASFIILALVWMTKGSVPSFICFLMVLPIIWGNVSSGIKSTDSQLLEMSKVFNFGFTKTVKKIYIPSVMPSFTAGCTTGLGLAWKAGIAAEVLSTPKNSIGTELYNSKIYLETTDLFAWTVLVIILSIVLEKVLVYIMKKVSVKYSLAKEAVQE